MYVLIEKSGRFLEALSKLALSKMRLCAFVFEKQEEGPLARFNEGVNRSERGANAKENHAGKPRQAGKPCV